MKDRKTDHNGSETHSGAGWTRRDVFGLAGMAFAASALPAFAWSEPENARQAPEPASPVMGRISPVMETLSNYMSAAGERALPTDVAETAKMHILDTIGAMVSGSQLLPGRKAIEFVENYGGKPLNTVIGAKVLCSPIEAALANAMMAHADETDDSSSPAKNHPGCGVVPAALAMGEHFGISGSRFVRAVTLGYDVGNRVTLSLGGREFEVKSHWSAHTIAPLFGASAACGSIAGFTPHQMRILLGYTAQQSCGLGAWQRDTQHIQKAFVYGGIAARGGTLSTLLVHTGWTGVEDIFSGPDNFYDAYKPTANREELVNKLGEQYQITLTDIKKWCVGSPIQAVLDAFVLIQKKHPFTADQVRHVEIQLATSLASIVNNRPMPDINVQQMAAVMMMDKTVTFKSANDEARMQDPATLKQRAKIQLVPSPELQRLIPERAAIVDVTLNDGTHLVQRVTKVRGSFVNPMTPEEVQTKARDLMVPVIGSAQTASLIDKVSNLERVKDIRELRPLLQRA